jgi:hypothetical protein
MKNSEAGKFSMVSRHNHQHLEPHLIPGPGFYDHGCSFGDHANKWEKKARVAQQRVPQRPDGHPAEPAD